jgi:uncharacterized protein with GYD domain
MTVTGNICNKNGRQRRIDAELYSTGQSDRSGRAGRQGHPAAPGEVREMVKKLGIVRKQVFMTFGPYDFVHILEAPDDQAIAKYVLALNAIGNVRTMTLKAFDETEHRAFIESLA